MNLHTIPRKVWNQTVVVKVRASFAVAEVQVKDGPQIRPRLGKSESPILLARPEGENTSALCSRLSEVPYSMLVYTSLPVVFYSTIK